MPARVIHVAVRGPDFKPAHPRGACCPCQRMVIALPVACRHNPQDTFPGEPGELQHQIPPARPAASLRRRSWRGVHRISLLPHVLVCLALNGCASQTVRPPAPQQLDTHNLSQQAAKAYQANEWVTAAKLYGRLARADSANPEYWYRLGNALVRLNKADAAVAAYRQALSQDPDDTRIWHNLGIVRLHQATEAFVELQQKAGGNDPLKARAEQMVQAIEQVLQSQVGKPGN